jgi:Acetyltransferase (GNAT) domain
MDYNKVSNGEWEEIILKSDNANFFHSPSWAKIVEKTYHNHTATRLYEINGKEILIPIMEANILGFKNFASIPFNTDAGGLFCESDITTDDFKLIVKDIVGGRNLSFFLALSPFMKLSPGKSSSPIQEDWKLNDEFTYTQLLGLEGKNYDYVWNNDFHRKARQKVRKAKKSGVEVRDGTSLVDFKAFYDIYVMASQKWGYETPQIPFKLCKNSYKYASSTTRLKLAIKDDEIIAGTLSFPYAKTFYQFMSVFLPEYGTFNPTSLLYNESIKQACQEGYKYFNCGTSGNLEHIRTFKEKFGAEKVVINRYRVYSNLGKMVSKINKRYRFYSNLAEIQNKINKLRIR